MVADQEVRGSSTSAGSEEGRKGEGWTTGRGSLARAPSPRDRTSSVSSWLSVCSLSSFPPLPPALPPPASLPFPMASISSMKTMEGDSERAFWYRSRTRDAPMPTKSSTNSEALTEKKGTLASPATALARRVCAGRGREEGSEVGAVRGGRKRQQQ